MIDNQIVELINKEIDGVASVDETARLRKAMSANPDVRTLFDDMRSVADAMANMASVDPPKTLKPAIMRAIEGLPWRKPATGPATVFHSFRVAFLRKPGFVFAGGLAAGFLVFALTMNLVAPRSVDDSELTGTLVLRGTAPGFSRGNLIDVNNDDVKGTIETQFGSGLCLLRLHLDAPQGVSVSIFTDPASVHLEAVRPSEDSGAQLSVREGELKFVGTKSGGIVALFSGSGRSLPPARLRLESSGKPVFEGIISLENSK
jgi:hypothetical protein